MANPTRKGISYNKLMFKANKLLSQDEPKKAEKQQPPSKKIEVSITKSKNPDEVSISEIKNYSFKQRSNSANTQIIESSYSATPPEYMNKKHNNPSDHAISKSSAYSRFDRDDGWRKVNRQSRMEVFSEAAREHSFKHRSNSPNALLAQPSYSPTSPEYLNKKHNNPSSHTIPESSAYSKFDRDNSFNNGWKKINRQDEMEGASEAARQHSFIQRSKSANALLEHPSYLPTSPEYLNKKHNNPSSHAISKSSTYSRFDRHDGWKKVNRQDKMEAARQHSFKHRSSSANALLVHPSYSPTSPEYLNKKHSNPSSHAISELSAYSKFHRDNSFNNGWKKINRQDKMEGAAQAARQHSFIQRSNSANALLEHPSYSPTSPEYLNKKHNNPSSHAISKSSAYSRFDRDTGWKKVNRQDKMEVASEAARQPPFPKKHLSNEQHYNGRNANFPGHHSFTKRFKKDNIKCFSYPSHVVPGSTPPGNKDMPPPPPPPPLPSTTERFDQTMHQRPVPSISHVAPSAFEEDVIANVRSLSHSAKMQLLSKVCDFEVETEDEERVVHDAINGLKQCLMQCSIGKLPPDVQRRLAVNILLKNDGTSSSTLVPTTTTDNSRSVESLSAVSKEDSQTEESALSVGQTHSTVTSLCQSNTVYASNITCYSTPIPTLCQSTNLLPTECISWKQQQFHRHQLPWNEQQSEQ